MPTEKETKSSAQLRARRSHEPGNQFGGVELFAVSILIVLLLAAAVFLFFMGFETFQLLKCKFTDDCSMDASAIDATVGNLNFYFMCLFATGVPLFLIAKFLGGRAKATRAASGNSDQQTGIVANGLFDGIEEPDDIGASNLRHTLMRLRHCVMHLQNTANTNLWLGVFIACFGAIFFVLALIKPQLNSLIKTGVMSTFIEVTAMFFFRNYRSLLKDIQFFQNEITNVELKLYALKYSCRHDHKAAEKEALKSFAATERNVIAPGNGGREERKEDAKEKAKSEKNLMKELLRALKRMAEVQQ